MCKGATAEDRGDLDRAGQSRNAEVGLAGSSRGARRATDRADSGGNRQISRQAGVQIGSEAGRS